MTAIRRLPTVCRRIRRATDARCATAVPLIEGTTAVHLLSAVRRRAYRDADSTTW